MEEHENLILNCRGA